MIAPNEDECCVVIPNFEMKSLQPDLTFNNIVVFTLSAQIYVYFPWKKDSLLFEI